MISKIRTLLAAISFALVGSVATAAVVEDPALYTDIALDGSFAFDGFVVSDLDMGPATLDIRYGGWTGAGDAVVELVFTFNGVDLAPAVISENAYFSTPESTSYDVTSLIVEGFNSLSVFGTLQGGGSTTYAVGELALEYVDTAAVPLPAGLPLLLVGLGGLGVVRRRAKAA